MSDYFDGCSIPKNLVIFTNKDYNYSSEETLIVRSDNCRSIESARDRMTYHAFNNICNCRIPQYPDERIIDNNDLKVKIVGGTSRLWNKNTESCLINIKNKNININVGVSSAGLLQIIPNLEIKNGEINQDVKLGFRNGEIFVIPTSIIDNIDTVKKQHIKTTRVYKPGGIYTTKTKASASIFLGKLYTHILNLRDYWMGEVKIRWSKKALPVYMFMSIYEFDGSKNNLVDLLDDMVNKSKKDGFYKLSDSIMYNRPERVFTNKMLNTENLGNKLFEVCKEIVEDYVKNRKSNQRNFDGTRLIKLACLSDTDKDIENPTELITNDILDILPTKYKIVTEDETEIVGRGISE